MSSLTSSQNSLNIFLALDDNMFLPFTCNWPFLQEALILFNGIYLRVHNLAVKVSHSNCAFLREITSGVHTAIFNSDLEL